MKGKRFCPIVLCFATTLGAFGFSGCSLIGYLAGSSADNREIEKSYSADELAFVPTGCEVEVHVDKGDVLRGTVLRMSREAAGKYAIRFDEWQQTYDSSHVVPGLGDTVFLGVPPRSDPGLSGTFAGFDPGAILVQRIDKRDTVNFWARSVAIAYDSRGNKIDWAAIRMLVREGKPPFLSSLVLQTSRGNIIVPLGTVTAVTAPVWSSRKWIGLGIGLVADAGFVALLIALGPHL